MFFDAHSHIIEAQSGGLLLSIEGEPVPGSKTYAQLLKQKPPKDFIVVPYVVSLADHLDKSIVYIHARRQKFTPAEVSDYLARCRATHIVLDTFNKFIWQADDCAALVRKHGDKTFLLAHGGGYDIREFVEMLRYFKNAYVDFSATQHLFGGAINEPKLDCGMKSAVVHALTEPKIRKQVLFGSDNPEFSQGQAVAWYESMDPDYMPLMRDNYLKFTSTLSKQPATAVA